MTRAENIEAVPPKLAWEAGVTLRIMSSIHEEKTSRKAI
jgi:hypothetical protein